MEKVKRRLYVSNKIRAGKKGTVHNVKSRKEDRRPETDSIQTVERACMLLWTGKVVGAQEVRLGAMITE